MIAALLVPLIAALPAMAPLLIQVGLFFINMFVKNQAQKDANAQAFLNAISAHANDALASVAERKNAWDQVKELREKAAARDAADQENHPTGPKEKGQP